MANQTASPNEAKVARELLEKMGERVAEPQAEDPLRNMNFRSARAKWESDETYRARQRGRTSYGERPEDFGRRQHQEAYDDLFGRSPFGEDFWAEWKRRQHGAPFASPPRDSSSRDSEYNLYARQKAAYERLLALFRDFRHDMSPDEYALWEKLIQQVDPNGVYFSEKIMARQRERAQERAYHQYDFKSGDFNFDFKTKYEWDFTKEAEKQANEEDAKMEAEQKRRDEAKAKAEQKIKDDRQRREQDEAMGAFEQWFHDFKKGPKP
jgi:hypothetical protein